MTPEEFIYKCEECSRAIVSHSLSGYHLECSIPFHLRQLPNFSIKCPQNLQHRPEQIIRSGLEKLQGKDFLSVEEMTI
jgi:hypothetical protein